MSAAGATRAPRPASTARLATAVCCAAALLLILLAGSAHAAAEASAAAAAAAPQPGKPAAQKPAAQKPVPATTTAKKPAAPAAAPTQATATAHGSKGSHSSSGGSGSRKRAQARQPSWLVRAPADKMAHVVLPGGSAANAPLTRTVPLPAPAGGAALHKHSSDKQQGSSKGKKKGGKKQQQAKQQQPRAGAATKPAPVVPTRFIVQVAAQPTASVLGTNSSSTRASMLGAVDAGATQAHALAAAVVTQVDSVAAAADVSAKVTRKLTNALSGFVVSGPTPAELKALAADPNVINVWPDGRFKTATYTSPEFLGLTSAGGEDAHRQGYGNKPPANGAAYGYDRGQGYRYVWDELGGVVGPDGAGEDVVIGVLDTGLWLEDHTSFAESSYWPACDLDNGQFYERPTGWQGTCQANGDGTTTFRCNNKVIGCRWYDTYGDGTLATLFPYETRGCKDTNGHGTHVAGIAAGNYGAESPGTPRGAVLSGMAPRARIAVYKVCWGRDEPAAGCSWSDIVAAVDDAIADGVSVIAFPAAGAGGDFLDSVVSLAFRNAAKAGVFVAAAAGNDGPAHGTVSNLAPWVTTVAASTQPRKVVASVVLGSGIHLQGSAPANQGPLGPLPLVYGAEAAIKRHADAGRCAPDSLDRDVIEGKIVICEGGHSLAVIAAQLAEVYRCGGAGVIFTTKPQEDSDGGNGCDCSAINGGGGGGGGGDDNGGGGGGGGDDNGGLLPDDNGGGGGRPPFGGGDDSGNDVGDDNPASSGTPLCSETKLPHLPYISLHAGERDALLQYAWHAKHPEAEFTPSRYDFDVTAPLMAGFSGRGPVKSLRQLVLKPEITAPGVNIHAADSPEGITKQLYNTYQGTSQATAQIAGIAALIRDKYPDWSPMAIKSAIMTTAYQRTVTGHDHKPFGTPLDYGAGHVAPQSALHPGLIITSSYADWLAFVCDVKHIFGDLTAAGCPLPFVSLGYPVSGSLLGGAGGGDDDDSSNEEDASAGSEAAVAVASAGEAAEVSPAEAEAAAGGDEHRLLSNAGGSRAPRVTRTKATQATGGAGDAAPPRYQPYHEEEPPPPPIHSHANDYDTCIQHTGDLNAPYITGVLSGSTTYERTLTAVLSKVDDGAVFFHSWAGPAPGSDFDVEVTPARFEAEDGDQVDVLITISPNSETPLNKPQTGQVVWYSADKKYRVTIPISVTFIAFSAPGELHIDPTVVNMTDFTYHYRISAYTSELVTVASTGLVPATITRASIPVTGNYSQAFTVGAGNTYAAFAIFDTDLPSGTNLDLYLYRLKSPPAVYGSPATVGNGPCSGNDLGQSAYVLVPGGFSTGGSSTEFIEIRQGQYLLVVDVVGDDSGIGLGTTVNIYSWLIAADGSSSTYTPGEPQLEVSPQHLALSPLDPCCCPVRLQFNDIDLDPTDPVERYIALITYESCSYKQQQLGRTIVYLFPTDTSTDNGGGDDSGGGVDDGGGGSLRLRQQQVQL